MRGTVLDTVTDLAARYILLLASTTAQNAFNNHSDYVPTIQDVRMAMTQAGGLRPQLSATQEEAKMPIVVNGRLVPYEDMRGVEAFIRWAEGAGNREIRRIAGIVSSEKDGGDVTLAEDSEDYLTALKKKYSKTGEESRYQGSVLGKDSDDQPVMIVGGPVGSLSEWPQHMKTAASSVAATPATSGISSAPDTPEELMGDAD
ncbi:MAG: hypothetical protein Q9227_004220 [Pyrenula ochraceoflavens]